jgi:hypothetical protein
MFPTDIERFVDFYTRVLRFELEVDRRSEPEPYVAVRRGATKIGAKRGLEGRRSACARRSAGNRGSPRSG